MTVLTWLTKQLTNQKLYTYTYIHIHILISGRVKFVGYTCESKKDDQVLGKTEVYKEPSVT